jgi:hypothetical protein
VSDIPLSDPTLAKVLAASPPERPQAADPERQRVLASMAHHLLHAEALPQEWPPERRAMVAAERQLRGMEGMGWSFVRVERATL